MSVCTYARTRLLTLALQNACLTIIMHFSRAFTPVDKTYSAASAVLLNEMLKGSISVAIALSRIDQLSSATGNIEPITTLPRMSKRTTPLARAKEALKHVSNFDIQIMNRRLQVLFKEVFSPDCWKLSIPAILYVVQNNLQFVAASNLDPATFQVTYQMKILTTAAFSVVLLRKRISKTKWVALFFLAIGVGIVQMQTGRPARTVSTESVGTPSTGAVPLDVHANVTQTVDQVVLSAIATKEIVTHEMNRLKGFLAVSLACITSGLAGVYFEMVLKGSKADLWVRNIQLSLFSIIPALMPIAFDSRPGAGWFSFSIFRYFGFWAWATVSIQVAGGLITAVVIKYSDNILKGFATSLSIIISFLASVVLFGDQITLSFMIGATTVLAATAMYNQPDKPASEFPKKNHGISGGNGSGKKGVLGSTLGLGLFMGEKKNHYHDSPLSPVGRDAPILGQLHSEKKHLSWTDVGASTGLPSGSPSPSPSVDSVRFISPTRLSFEGTRGQVPMPSLSTKSPSPSPSNPQLNQSDSLAYPSAADSGKSPNSQRRQSGAEKQMNRGWRHDC